MSKRAKEPGPVPVTRDQVLLFDVPAPPRPPEAEGGPVKPRPCEVCGRMLRSKRAVEAGAGQTCAAKVGRAVLASTRSSRRARVTAVAEAV
ncbi:hypothetical protein GR925_27515 [Streptomyces sp. HUCO-GS316]|uniref:DUF6011 domain-containing protein n=1 Tax=Streptomyces sp. HUCO-GS316 TaxID=2692198 RepID=UPI001370C3E4|nr:DUF6011 domain-containing protein [Streptomyces sp. HUCO-GS316]MXM67078.1 hypothetical protein [Streptomyces sp. HUCO-GS316]